MRKTLFIIATVYAFFYLISIWPAFGYSQSFFIHRYSATEREQIIIKDVYEKMMTQGTISFLSFFGIYGFFAASMFCERKKKTTSA